MKTKKNLNNKVYSQVGTFVGNQSIAKKNQWNNLQRTKHIEEF